jgi:hypothetical protein
MPRSVKIDGPRGERGGPRDGWYVLAILTLVTFLRFPSRYSQA